MMGEGPVSLTDADSLNNEDRLELLDMFTRAHRQPPVGTMFYTQSKAIAALGDSVYGYPLIARLGDVS